ncbi:MAG: metallophosphoesterase family protein [Kiritimatiellia bacterium]
MTRRDFIGSGAAFAALHGFASAEAVLGGRPNVRFGVLSDIHVTNWESAETFRHALRYYREADVDAVMICGDMADFGVLCNLETVAKSWYEVFPGDRGRDGRQVEKLFIYGNHDVESGSYGIGNVGLATSLIMCPGYKTEEVKAQAICRLGLAECWEKCFHEPFAPIYRKTVRGYDFIGAHWDTQARVRGLEQFFAQHGASLGRTRPFFYFQHPHPADTVYVNGPFTHDDGCATRVLSDYPNAVAFSGHSHTSLTDEHSLWRGAFTSIGSSTLTPRGSAEPYLLLENRFGAVDPTEPSRQGMLVSVYDDRMVIVRRDFTADEELDEPWVIPVPAKAESFAERAAKSAAPQFAADARLAVHVPKKVGEAGFVRFPPALAEPKTRPFDYAVTIDYRYSGELMSTHMFRAYGPTSVRPKAHDADVRRITIPVPAAYLPKYDVGEVRVTVAPRNSFGREGRALVSAWTKVPKM